MRLNGQGEEDEDFQVVGSTYKHRNATRSSIERIRPIQHKLIESWYAARGRKVNVDTFSDCGFIVDGRVAGFLYVTNSSMAMIEGIVSNPYTVPSLRRHSMKKLLGVLIDTATMLGFTHIFGISKHPSLEKAAKEFGFKQEVYNVYVLDSEKD